MSDTLTRLTAALADRYELKRELGRGGMATVYLAHDRKQDRLVAVKVLRPELAASIGSERFLREIAITGKLVHPNILPLLESDERDGFLYYVMPYVEGETLRDRLSREGQLPIEDAIQITTDAAEGLGYAHSLGVIHRDIKPENIFLAAGKAVIGDFGIARAVSEAGGERLTETGLAMGTPAYMSPEQAMGERDVDARSDIYSLGTVLYEMLGGEPPFTGATPQHILARKVTDAVPSLRAVRETVAPEFENVVMKSLARSAADRFTTAERFVQALNDPANVTPVHTQAQPAMITLGVSTRTVVKLGVVAVLVVVGVLIATVGWFGRSAQRTGVDGPARVAVLPLENQTDDASLGSLGLLFADEVTRTVDSAGSVDIVETAAAQRLLAGAGNDTIEILTDDLGTTVGVFGSTRTVGDRVRIDARIEDLRTGERVWGLTPYTSSRDSLDIAVSAMSDRAAAAVLFYFDPEVRVYSVGFSAPGSMEVLREYRTGMANFCRGAARRAAAAFDRVRELDSSYAPALLYSAQVLGLATRNWSRSDSVLQMVEQMESALTSVERLYMRYLQAQLEARWRPALSTTRQLADIDPNWWGPDVGLMALSLNRPEEAVRYYEAIDDDFPCVGGLLHAPTLAYHVLGEYEKELEWHLAKRTRGEIWPRQLIGEARALAGLGRVEAVDSLMEFASTALFAVRDQAEVFREAGLELKAHGFPEQGQRWLDEAVAQTLDSTGTPSAAYLYLAGRYEEALPVFQDRFRRTGNSPAYLGTTLAALGHREEALSHADSLSTWEPGPRLRPEMRAFATMRRAAVLAHLGDAESAVRELKKGYDEGWPYWPVDHGLGNAIWLHNNPDLDPIRDHPMFKELIRPKG